MDIDDQLARDLRGCASSQPDFFKKGYEEALTRLEDFRGQIVGGVPNPHVTGPTDQHCAVPGEILYYDGGTSNPDEARRAAFELLALANLAELMA
jgi:hypothetical protein